ncbi:MAG TPA: helix-turn-helix transcriptional regulator [Candidatus Dormibacteraeota bacterium]
MVRQLREARGLSQRELAERIGSTAAIVSRLEAGGSSPTIDVLERLADALGVRLELRFMNLEGRPPRHEGRRVLDEMTAAAEEAPGGYR